MNRRSDVDNKRMLLMLIAGYSYEDTGKALGISKSTVHFRLKKLGALRAEQSRRRTNTRKSVYDERKAVQGNARSHNEQQD